MNISVADVRNYSYNELIGVLKETNRPPGGIRSLYRLSQLAQLDASSKILEVGTSTGFSAIELAKVSKSRIFSIDINETSLQEAAARADHENVADRIDFSKQDVTQLEFADSFFDMVFCGNVTSIVSDREKAMSEYARVLKSGGLLAAIPMYYIQVPSADLVRDVSKAIQVNITPHDEEYWLKFFDRQPFSVLFNERYMFDEIDRGRVERFCDEIFRRPHLANLAPDVLEALKEKYRIHMELFRRNLALMGFSIIILRKDSNVFEEELFTSQRR